MELEKVSSDIDRLWSKLRAVTPARIGLARSGSWVETRLLLEFQLAHAEAQDGIVRPIFRAVFGCGSFSPWATRSDISTARQK